MHIIYWRSEHWHGPKLSLNDHKANVVFNCERLDAIQTDFTERIPYILNMKWYLKAFSSEETDVNLQKQIT